MCMTVKEMNENMQEIQSLKRLKEEIDQNIAALERKVITFLQETETCKTTNKKGKDIFQFIGNMCTATYGEQSRETVNKEEVKKILSEEEYQKVSKVSTFNVLRIK